MEEKVLLNKKIMMLAILLVSLLAISAVSAVDNTTSDVVGVEETTDEVVSVENDYYVTELVDERIDYLSSNLDGTFSDLASDVANANGELVLTKNYVYDSSKDSNYTNGIIIDKELIINGKGFSINGNDNARAFKITCDNVILRNIEFIKCSNPNYGGAVYCNGANGDIYDCNFIDCHSSGTTSGTTYYGAGYTSRDTGSGYGGAVYWSGENGNLHECTFTNCYSSCCGGAVYWDGENGNLHDCEFINCYIYNYNNEYAYRYSSGASSSIFGSGYGGAVYWNKGNGNIQNCNFIECHSSSFSSASSINNGVDLSSDPYKATSSTTSSSSTSSSYGGAIYWNGENGNLQNCNFIDCYSYSNSSSGSQSGFTHYTKWGSNSYTTSRYSCHSSSSCNSYSYESVYWYGDNGNIFNCNFINSTSSYASDQSSDSDSGDYVKSSCNSYSSTFGGAVYWNGMKGNLSNCSFINSNPSSSLGHNGTVYWYGTNGNQFNCSFNENYYNYEEYCAKKDTSIVSPVILIHTNTLNNDNRIVIFESTPLVNNIAVKLYNVTDRKILYKEFTISSEDLTYSLNLNNLEAGEYQIVLEYAGDDFYTTSSSNDLFKIGMNSSYEVTITENLIAGDEVTINLTLNNDATGKVKLTLADYTFVNDLSDGKASFSISNINGGVNTYQIKYVGDDKYNPLYISNTFNVLFKSDINLNLKENNVFGDNIALTYTITPNCTGIISIYVNNVFKANISVGDVYELENLDAGKYNITFIYDGDEHFTRCSDSAMLIVSKADTSIDVDSSNMPGTITFDVILNEKATGNITLALNNNDLYSGTLLNGKVNIIVPNVNAGNYTVKINYTGDKNYNVKTYSTKLTINKLSTTVMGTVEDITYSQDAIVNVKGSVDGIVVAKIDDTFIENINIISNSIAPVTFENIPAGKHNVTITLKPSNINYDESTYNTDFTVNKKDTTVKLDVENSVYGEEVIVNVTASNDGKVIVTMGDITNEKNVFANTLTKINMGVLAADSYDVIASFDAGNNYKSSNDNGNIIISPAEAQITEIQTTNNTYGEKTIIKVKTNVAGTLNIKVESTEKSFYVNANKLASLDLGILDAGLQNVEITLDAGSNYTKPEKNTQVNIAPKSTTVNVNVENYIYGENVIVGVTASENGRVTVKLGGIVKYGDVTANKISLVDFGIVDAKSYAVNVTFNAGNNYEESYNSAALTVSPAQSKITEIDAQNNVYGEKIIIKVKTNVDGALTVKLGENTKVINVIADQIASVDFGILDVNNYDVKLSLNAGNNYLSSQNTTTITISPKNTDVTLNVKEYNAREHVIVNVTASENGKVTIKLNNIIKNIDVIANMDVSVDFGVLNCGSYDVVANFSAGNNYIDSSDSAIINVLTKIDEEDIDISVPEIKPNQENNIVINLPADATGTVTLVIGNASYTFDVKNGVANVNVPKLDVGNYDYVINYSGDNKYSSFENSGHIDVEKPTPEIVVPPLDKPSADGSVAINLPSDATGTVTLVIGGKPYSFPIINGVANVYMPDLSNGDYNYTITYSGDVKYSAFTNTGNVNINKIISTSISASTVTTVYNGNKYLVVSLKDSQGNAVSGVQLTVVLNDKVYTPTTDSDGQIKISTNGLAPKSYIATITFGGNSKYDKSNANVNVVVKKATPKLTAKAKTFKKSVKTKKYSVTLKTNQNKVMKNTKLTLKVNGKTYSAKTNSKGQATFKITKLTKKGKFTAVVKFAGNKYYNAKTAKPKITVK